jgi:hypothetical protein
MHGSGTIGRWRVWNNEVRYGYLLVIDEVGSCQCGTFIPFNFQSLSGLVEVVEPTTA